ncbi:FAD/FMN-containing dehydrogenase [Lipingzhangella halophila]|uniref:FAD/FMN-containing dehydrogenase n=1 Tax=Lipingzhangella halophila TaxID=1783352 RepID=A0A7W7W3L7_9ACTN|nr:FAD-binding oxidoreductase [Lipingzhangella halophila]MBB4932911.1 FAD/FMN-containing dehydrogenase [Lipingzhangella halophila]
MSDEPATTRRGARALARRREGIDYDGIPANLAERAVEPGDRRYDAVRHNYLRSGSPGLVLYPRDRDEVAEALAFARGQDVPLGVRSGGHGISGRSTNDGGIVLDLKTFDGVDVLDNEAGLVRLGAGAMWRTVAEELVPHGLAVTSGDNGAVGVGGLATTGGMGLLGRSQGLTIDRVRAYHVVTAEGRPLRASADENPDLFWGLRGAGGNLAVVTSVELEAGRLGDVIFSQMVLDASDAAGLLERWGAAVEAAPRALTSFLYLSARQRAPLAQLLTIWAGDDQDAAVAALDSLAGSGPLLGHQAVQVPYSQVMPYSDAQRFGGGDPAARSGLVTHLDGGVSRAVADLVRSGETSVLAVRAYGGAAHDVAHDATAYAHRHQHFSLGALGVSQTRLNEAWDAGISALTDGLYLPFDKDTRPERVREAFPGGTFARVSRLKREYDPENAFSANFPIPPA